MRELTIRLGDVVRLRTSLIKMTVGEIYSPYVECIWFEGETLYKAGFDFNSLIKVKK